MKLKLMLFAVLLGFTPSFSAIAYDPLDCLNEASKVDKDIIAGLATKLCSGAWTAEPVKCYAQVSRVYSSIPRGIAIDLCSGSANAENTVRCYGKASEKRSCALSSCKALRSKKVVGKSLVLGALIPPIR